MARLHVMERSHAQAVMDDLHDALGRRLAVSSLAPCPVEFTAALVNLCSTQSCGKCTPCRVGLNALSDLLADVLEGRADESTLNLIERTARTIYLSSDCAIGYEAGAMALTAIRGFRDDFEHHIREHSCGFDREARVPCVSGCPAHVDIPGYISLVEAGRYADAVKVIRKNNPLPLVCGLVCEHPCEMHCRRGMVDDLMNILALKRFAVEHSDLNDHKPYVVDNTGKRVAVIGGGPTGLSTGKGTTPEYVMNYLLERAGLTGQVALEFKSEPTEVLSALLADPSAVGVLPEPFKTAAIAKSEGKLSAPVSLTDVWDELAGDTGSRLLTGATVVRRAFAEEHPEAVAEFLSCHAASVKAVNAAPADWAQAVVDAGIVDNAKIAEKAIPGCMLVCQTGKDMKAALSEYLQVLSDADASAVGGKLPADDFYYLG